MKIKLKEVQNYAVRLGALRDKVLPARFSFAITHNVEKLQKEMESIEKERLKICERYSEKDADGRPVFVDNIVDGTKVQSYKISAEGQQAPVEEYSEMMETEIDIDIRKVDQEIIEKCESSERYDVLSVAEIAALSFMIEG